MPYTEATLNAMADAIGNAVPLAGGTITVSLHTADPGSTGTNEITGGSYARQTATFGTTASGGSIANTVALNFTSMPAATVSHIGIWSGATFRAGAALTAPQSVSAGQTFTMAIGQLVANLNGAGSKISTYAKNALLNALFRNVSFSVTTPYVSLHTADPGDTGTGEVTGGTYARKAVTFAPASGGQAANDALERIDGMPAVTVSHSGLFDAISAGNWLGGNAITARTFVAGDAGEFIAGTIVIG